MASYKGRRRSPSSSPWRTLLLAILLLALVGALIFGVIKLLDGRKGPSGPGGTTGGSKTSSTTNGTGPDDQTTTTTTTESGESRAKELVEKARTMAAGYDFDGAIELLKKEPNYESSNLLKHEVSELEKQKAGMVKWSDNSKISHLFIHALIVDTSLAFDGDSDSTGYNSNMVTVDEFNKVLTQLHERGYVLVGLHQIASLDANGVMQYNPIMLPAGKKPLVMSQDDVCYYEYMDGDGFANKLVIGEDGFVTCEMKLKDGSVVYGDYDFVPILEAFIREHPDFSYRGARGIIAVTGYNGVLGYRTSDRCYGPNATAWVNPNLQQDKEKAAEVAQALRDQGWEFASHSWGHRNYGSTAMDSFKWDVDMWEKECESIIGDTDIVIFPFGTDIGSWRTYSEENERYTYLRSKGFHYYCNVDASVHYWVQKGKDYLRQGRINIDGYRLWRNVNGDEELLSVFFDSNSVFDRDRVTPVPRS